MEIVNTDVCLYGGVEYTTVTEYTSNGFVYHLSYKGIDKIHTITFNSVRDYSDYICFLQLKDLTCVQST